MLYLNERQKTYLKQLLLYFTFLYLIGTLAIGGVIANSIIQPTRLLSLAYIPLKANCTIYLQEFQKVNTLAQKQNQLSQAINCLEQFQYPQNQEYLNLKSNLAQLNVDLSIDQFLEISRNIQQTNIDRGSLKAVTTPPIARYIHLLFAYLAIILIFTLISLVIWLILIDCLDYYFLEREIKIIVLIILETVAISL